jgi:hypothetical protein
MAKRIKSYDEARSVITDLKNQDEQRGVARAKVEGQISGNLPYNPEELRQLGQAYRSNINFLELDGNTKTRLSGFVRLLFDTPILAQIFMDHDEIPINQRAKYCDIVADEFTKMIKRKWKGFFLQFSRAMRNMVVHGIGTLYWPTQRSFKFKSAIPGGIRFSHMSPEDSDEFDIVEIIGDISIDKLFDLISSPKQADVSKKRGWNTGIIFSILEGVAKKDSIEGFGAPPQTPEEFTALQNKRSLFKPLNSAPRSVMVSHVYSREESGGVTHAIVIADETVFDDKKLTGEKYLYYKSEEYAAFPEFVVPLICDIGNEGIHAIRGYGHKIYAHCVVSNRMLNSLNDSAILSSTLLIKSPTSGEKSMGDVIRLGPITAIPSDCEVVTGGISASGEGLFRARAVLAANMANNFGNERPNAEGSLPNQSYKTARQTDSEMLKSKSISNVETMIFYLFADQVIGNMFERLFTPNMNPEDTAIVAKFKKRCVARGVPKNLLTKEFFYAQASRAIGFGSQEMQLGITRDMISVAPYLPEVGKKQVIRDYTLARVGADNLERYYPDMDVDKLTHYSHQLARFENNDMMLGQPATVSSDDDHPYHLQEHMRDALETIGQFAKGELPMPASEMLAFVGQVTAHVTQHISFLQGVVYEQLVKQTVDELKQIQGFYKKLQGMAKQEQAQQQQEAQQQQQVLAQAAEALKGTDAAIEIEKVRGSLQIKAQKEQATMALKEQKQAHGQMLAEQMTNARIQMMERESQSKQRTTGEM